MIHARRLCAAMAVAVLAAAAGHARADEPRWVDPRSHDPFLHQLEPTAEPKAPGAEPAPNTVVDQAVEDVDPLAHSLRRVEPGHALFPDHARVRRVAPGSPGVWSQLGMPELDPHAYRYHAPGVRAWVRRPGYIVRTPAPGTRRGWDPALDRAPLRDGEHIEIIPADTVFDLIPPNHAASLTPPAAADDHEHAQPREPGSRQAPRPIGNRLDTRLDTRIDGRVQP